MPADTTSGTESCNISIGFVVLAHQHFNHVERLVRRLTQFGDPLLVHVDRGVGERPFKALAERLSDLQRVWVCQDIRTAWGSYGLVEATAEMTRRILSLNSALDFVSLHSGTDYPARSLSAYRQFLADNRSRGFVSFFDGANEQYGFRSRYQLYYPFPYFVRHARARRIAMYMQQWLGIRRVPLAGLSPAFGWHWWTLPVPIATWLAEESLSPRIARFYRTTAIPEEMLFQTLLANSHHRGNIERNNLRFVKASASGHIPKWLDINDLSDICNSGAFFCRKVVAGRDLGLCEALERQPA